MEKKVMWCYCTYMQSARTLSFQQFLIPIYMIPIMSWFLRCVLPNYCVALFERWINMFCRDIIIMSSRWVQWLGSPLLCCYLYYLYVCVLVAFVSSLVIIILYRIETLCWSTLVILIFLVKLWIKLIRQEKQNLDSRVLPTCNNLYSEEKHFFFFFLISSHSYSTQLGAGNCVITSRNCWSYMYACFLFNFLSFFVL